MYNEERQQVDIPSKERIEAMFNQIQDNTSTLLQKITEISIEVHHLTIEVRELKLEVMSHHDKLLVMKTKSAGMAKLAHWTWENLFKVGGIIFALGFIYSKFKFLIPGIGG